MLEILKIIVKKIRLIIFYRIVSILRFSKLNNKFRYNKQLKENELTYLYFKKIYNSYLKKMPVYKNTHKYSNYIWWCWLQGEENAPKLNKACLNSLRKNLPGKEIVVITRENYNKYIQFPKHIIEKYNKGIISHTHFSDLIRLELLEKYGGTWIDSSVLCTSYDKDFYDKDLFVFENFMKNDDAIVCSNWFITADIGNPIIKTTKELLFKYWKDNNYLINYYIFHIFFTIATEKYNSEYMKVNRFSNVPPHILQFELTRKYSEERFEQIKRISSIHKLSQKIDFSHCNGDTNYDFILKKYIEGE